MKAFRYYVGLKKMTDFKSGIMSFQTHATLFNK